MTSSIIDGIGHWSRLHQNHPWHFLLIWQQINTYSVQQRPLQAVQFPNYPAVNMTAGLQNTNRRAPAVRFFQENLRHDDSNLSWPSNQTIPHNPPPKKWTSKNSSKIQKKTPVSSCTWLIVLGSLIYLPIWGWAMISPLYRDVKIWRKLRQTCRSPGVHLVWRFPRVDVHKVCPKPN